LPNNCFVRRSNDADDPLSNLVAWVGCCASWKRRSRAGATGVCRTAGFWHDGQLAALLCRSCYGTARGQHLRWGRGQLNLKLVSTRWLHCPASRRKVVLKVPRSLFHWIQIRGPRAFAGLRYPGYGSGIPKRFTCHPYSSHESRVTSHESRVTTVTRFKLISLDS
jgi:hypothetical protein